MRTHRAAPVVAAALAVFVTLTVGSSAAQHYVPAEQSGNGGMAAAYPMAPQTDATGEQGASNVPAAQPTEATPTTTATSRSDPVTPEAKAIAAVAKMLNGPAFERALDEPEPRRLGPSDTWGVAQSDWESSSAMWSGLIDQFRLKGDLLTFRPLIYNEAFEDEEETGCTYLNNDKKTVRSSSPLPFFCPADKQNGTLYWPVKAMEREWEAAGDMPTTLVVRGLDIVMHRLIGEAIAIQIYNTYQGMLGAEELPMPMQPATEALGYCFAGTALQGQYFDRGAALNGMAFAYPAHDRNQKEFARALSFGFDTNDLGKCMVEFWPR